METLKTGDVVKLKSGGPLMTIEDIGKYDHVDEDQALCKWFKGNEVVEDTFRLTSLEIVEEDLNGPDPMP